MKMDSNVTGTHPQVTNAVLSTSIVTEALALVAVTGRKAAQSNNYWWWCIIAIFQVVGNIAIMHHHQ